MTPMKLLVSGAGDLGMRVARLFAASGTALLASEIFCETRSRKSHARIKSEGFSVKCIDDVPVVADSLIVSFPPSDHYLRDLSAALKQWNRRGCGLMVSSTGVYLENQGNLVDEASPVDQQSVIVAAENLARSQGLHIVRMAGLYDRHTGPQIYWQKKQDQEKKALDSDGEGYINLIHRDEAAEALVRVLQSSSNTTPELWNLSDGYPLSRKMIAEAWAQYLQLPACTFSGYSANSKSGKKVNCDKFQKAFAWKLHGGFLEFLKKLK